MSFLERRMRSLGMLASIGATDRNVGQVVRPNGLVTGVAGAVLGSVLGFVVTAAIALAIVATYLAAAGPARSVKKVSITATLSGRPAPPRRIRRSAVPGIVCGVIAFLLLGYSGGTNGGTGSGGSLELVLGLVTLIPAVILLAPLCLTFLARLGRRTPVAIRLALRDLARYRARSGSAMAAASIGVMIAVIVVGHAAAAQGLRSTAGSPRSATSRSATCSCCSSGHRSPQPPRPGCSAAGTRRRAGAVS